MDEQSNQPKPEETFTRHMLREVFSHEIRNLFFIVIGFVVVGTLFYKYEEAWSWIDSFYFSVITLTTVGYGDLAPSTDLSKIFTSMYIFGGLGIVLTFLQTIAREQAKEPFFFRLINRQKSDKKD